MYLTSDNQLLSHPFLDWNDIANIFNCGKSKAMLIMHSIGVIYIGSKAYIRSEDLENHLAKHGEIAITWPRKRA